MPGGACEEPGHPCGHGRPGARRRRGRWAPGRRRGGPRGVPGAPRPAGRVNVRVRAPGGARASRGATGPATFAVQREAGRAQPLASGTRGGCATWPCPVPGASGTAAPRKRARGAGATARAGGARRGGPRVQAASRPPMRCKGGRARTAAGGADATGGGAAVARAPGAQRRPHRGSARAGRRGRRGPRRAGREPPKAARAPRERRERDNARHREVPTEAARTKRRARTPGGAGARCKAGAGGVPQPGREQAPGPTGCCRPGGGRPRGQTRGPTGCCRPGGGRLQGRPGRRSAASRTGAGAAPCLRRGLRGASVRRDASAGSRPVFEAGPQRTRVVSRTRLRDIVKAPAEVVSCARRWSMACAWADGPEPCELVPLRSPVELVASGGTRFSRLGVRGARAQRVPKAAVGPETLKAPPGGMRRRQNDTPEPHESGPPGGVRRRQHFMNGRTAPDPPEGVDREVVENPAEVLKV